MPVRNKTKAICPMCETTHIVCLDYEWTGTTQPYVYCKDCANHKLRQPLQSAMSPAKEKRSINPRGWKHPHKLTQEQKVKRNLELELEGRKLRQKYGIKAPAHWFRIPDHYDGRFGGYYGSAA